MPRNVRNFWVEGHVDGREEPIGFGPKAKDGGFELIVYQRDKGDVTIAGRIYGLAGDDGKLAVRFEPDRAAMAAGRVIVGASRPFDALGSHAITVESTR